MVVDMVKDYKLHTQFVKENQLVLINFINVEIG